MTTRRVPPAPGLHLIPDPVPHGQPVSRVFKRSRGGGRFEPVVDYDDVLHDAMTLAQQLICHPHCLDRISGIIQGQDLPDGLVAKAVRQVLATTAWFIEVVHGDAHFTAKHRELSGPSDTMDFRERLLTVNDFYLSRLKAARRSSDQIDYARHLYHMACIIAHELVHALRLQVFYLLVPYDIPIPLSDPAGGGFRPSQSGWEFEEQLNGGRIEGAWARGDLLSSPTPDMDPGQVTPDWEALLRKEEQRYERVVQAQSNHFHCLLIRPKDDEHNACLNIKDSWILQIPTALTNGTVSEVQLPPPCWPGPIDERTIVTVFRADNTCERTEAIVFAKPKRHEMSTQNVAT